MPRPVREVEDPSAHERRRAVREDVAEPRREECDRMRRRDREPESRMAEQLELVVERPVVRQRARVVLPLVVGKRPRRLARRTRSRRPCRHRLAPRSGRRSSPRDANGPRRSRSAGHVGSDRHSPRISARSGAGRVERRMNTAIGGSSSMPFGSSREASARTSGSARARGRCAGPGSTSPWRQCAHGPMSTRHGQRERLVGAKRDVRVAVGPAGDDHRRARDPLVAAAAAIRGASTARRPAPRASAGATARFPRSGGATPRASRRRRRPERAAGRCRPPCRSPSRRGRSP